MTSISTLPVPDSLEAVLEQRDRTLATLFKPGELVLQVGETYDPVMHTWTIDIVRMGIQGRWMRQRYTYDVARAIVYFFGESSLSEEAFGALRREAKVLQQA